MAITITKSAPAKTQVKAVPKPPKAIVQAEEKQQTEREMLADELINLDLKLKAANVAAINKRITEIKGVLQSIAAAECEPTESLTIKGQHGVVSLGPQANTSVILDMDGLIQYAVDKVGKDAIMAKVKITQGDLQQVLSQAEIEKFSQSAYGNRVCKIIPAP
jgi:hypothetical protein